MDSDVILSFRNPQSERDRVEAFASPVLELAYAHYYLLTRIAQVARNDRMPWAVALEQDEPELVQALRALWPPGSPTILPALMAAEFDYLADDDPERFLDDFPSLLARTVERIRQHQPTDPDEPEELAAGRSQMLHAAEELGSGERSQYPARLHALWARLEPAWSHDGKGLVEAACHAFGTKFDATGDVLQALPAHHFTQFEKAAGQIRASQERRRVQVIPLYYASDGGINLELDHSHTIGYGLQSERLFESTNARVRELAHAAKAFADPTRLMLLTLIARYGKLSLTVGDLAAQLDVSQPTVSGHLKLLRQMGFVELTKRGTKSYYHLATTELRRALDEIAALLLD